MVKRREKVVAPGCMGGYSRRQTCSLKTTYFTRKKLHVMTGTRDSPRGSEEFAEKRAGKLGGRQLIDCNPAVREVMSPDRFPWQPKKVVRKV